MQTILNDQDNGRRHFLKSGLIAMAGGMSMIPAVTEAHETVADKNLCVIGPISGYTPQIGALVTMMNYNRATVIGITKNLTVEQLDFLVDPQANSIGALLMHLAAVEFYYQVNSFEDRQEFNEEEKKFWGPAMDLGDAGRKEIKGKELSYYTDLLEKGRQKTLDAFKKKDDKWLAKIDPVWSKEENYNTHWKWFHVCEHEANHRGQIAFIKGRLPGAKKGGGEG